MKKYIKTTIIILLAFILTSCNKFLTIYPEHEQVIETAVQNYDGAVAILNGVYASLSVNAAGSGVDHFGGSLFCTMSSMAGVGRAVGGATAYNMQFISTTGSLGNYWSIFYGCMNSANAAIIAVTNLDDTFFPSVDEKNRILSEAKVLRAWACTHILWGFCHYWKDDEYGIIWREEIANFDNIVVPRISVRESYEVIFKDIDEALPYLKDYTTSKRVSTQMAQMLKAKLLLNRGWDGDYTASLGLVNTILTTAPAIFKMNPDMTQMYIDSWDSNEVLWARFTEENGYRAYGEGSYSQSIIQSGDVWSAESSVNPSSAKSFYDQFNEWIENDPRRDATMGWARAISATGLLYYCPTKLAREGRPLSTSHNDKFTSYYMRYAELYIMQAELRAKTGSSLADAIAPINTMRSKRTKPVLPQLATPATMDELLEIIFKEYCLELYQENGSDWLASVRIKRDGLPYFQFMKPDIDPVDDNKWIWPIPSTELSTNDKMVPNPGFDS